MAAERTTPFHAWNGTVFSSAHAAAAYLGTTFFDAAGMALDLTRDEMEFLRRCNLSAQAWHDTPFFLAPEITSSEQFHWLAKRVERRLAPLVAAMEELSQMDSENEPIQAEMTIELARALKGSKPEDARFLGLSLDQWFFGLSWSVMFDRGAQEPDQGGGACISSDAMLPAVLSGPDLARMLKLPPGVVAGAGDSPVRQLAARLTGSKMRQLLQLLLDAGRVVPITTILRAIYGDDSKRWLEALMTLVKRANTKLAEHDTKAEIRKEGETLVLGSLHS